MSRESAGDIERSDKRCKKCSLFGHRFPICYFQNEDRYTNELRLLRKLVVRDKSKLRNDLPDQI
jgi:hypothetical protein